MVLNHFITHKSDYTLQKRNPVHSEMANSSSESHHWNYEVFLSFRGEDTRRNFVDHLYTALVQNGIRTFKDDDEDDSRAASEAIEKSRCAIVIFSKSYGSSKCLDELVKIMECNKKIGQLVLPIFYYDFNSSNLRRQGSLFGKLFSNYDIKKVRAWTSALAEAANLSGRNLIDFRYKATHIQEIVEIISGNFGLKMLSIHQNLTGAKHDNFGVKSSNYENLIGIERRVREVKSLLQADTGKIAGKSEFASSSPLSSRRTYDVLLSFRGNDICKDFVQQLYRALGERQIYTFSGNQRLGSDESSASQLLKAIEESSLVVVILSKNYASSSQCLDELVKVMNCNEENGQIVFPVFYDVDPSDVRNQKGFFGEAFMQDKPEKVETWRKALVKASSLAGWYFLDTPKSHGAPIISSIVDTISRRLVHLSSSVDDNLIGIESRMKHVMSLLELESGGVRMLGIWGMGGVGKTTIARAVYEKAFNYFDCSCFIENVREVSSRFRLEYVQKEVLSTILKVDQLHVYSVHEGTSRIKNRLCDRKVLIVLDDVDHESQLEALAGSCSWFGEGSRIIVTTRDEHVLMAHNIMHIYYVRLLNDDESIQFLRRHAFKKDDLTKEYEDLLLQVVHYAAGLPLVLKVVSSLLCGRSKKEWASTLARLEAFPQKEIQNTLKISFDGLDDSVKGIFLDVACFFNGVEKDRVIRILDSRGFSGDEGIRLLEQKSLVHILEERIQMHNLLQQMGRDIVRQEHPDEPGKRSRLWHAEEVSEVLMENTGTKAVSGIVVDELHIDALDMTEEFKGLESLTLLQIHSCNKSMLLKGSSYLPNELRWITWHNYPLQSLPESFNANKLVGLELVGSSISKLWPVPKYAGMLRFLDLSHSKTLIQTPDFTWIPNLTRLNLENCIGLMKVHKSIGSLKRLFFLNLRWCRRLQTLPRSIMRLKSLNYLYLRGCSNLKIQGSIGGLLRFHSDSSYIIMVPSLSFGFLNNLIHLDFSNLNSTRLPDSISSSVHVETLSLRTCTRQLKSPLHIPKLEIPDLHLCPSCGKFDVNKSIESSGNLMSKSEDDETSTEQMMEIKPSMRRPLLLMLEDSYIICIGALYFMYCGMKTHRS